MTPMTRDSGNHTPGTHNRVIPPANRDAPAVLGTARRDGILHVEGVSLDHLAQCYGTPLYVYSRGMIDDAVTRLESAFGPLGAGICFALKANSNPSLLTIIAGRGCGADIVSGGELAAALRARFDPEKIIFSGVGKQEWEIRRALEAGIGQFNVESPEELDDIIAIGKAMKRTAPVALRLNPDIAAPTHDKIATGRADDKFGIEAAALPAMVARIRRCKHLDFRGLAIHIGSQIRDIDAFRRGWRTLCKSVGDIGPRVPCLDLGGGMAVRTTRSDPPFDLAALANAARPCRNMADHIMIEPGRYICAEAGIILSRTIRIKSTTRQRFIIIDAAMNDFIRPALYDARHPIDVVAAPDNTIRDNAIRGKKSHDAPDVGPDVGNVVGPICESADIFSRGESGGSNALARVEKNDLVVIGSAGAYGTVMASNYNLRPRAAEVLVEGNRHRLIRPRQTIEEIIAPPVF